MIYTEHLTNIFLVLIVSSSLINYGESSEAGNWVTKSLDYYSLEKCSPLDKSGITGDFHACLNSPVDSSSSTGSTNSPLASGQPASGNWGKFGSTGGVGGFGSSGGFNGFTSSQSKTSPDSWPLSLVNDLQHMINCFPKLIKPCMTESEVQFFNTINGFFQAQVNYASPNASLIAARIASTGCVQSNSIDTNTICYSTNVHKQNWFGWKINWADGQMCRFIDDISKCELSSFDKCPSDVRQFADGLWEAGLEVTSCLDEIITTTTTTLSSPSPITVNPVNQTKSLAPGSSVSKVDPNQLPSHLTNVTNINSNDQQSLEVTVNNLTVNKYNDVADAVKGQNEEDTVHSKPLVPAIPNRPGFFGRIIKNNEFDQRQQLDDNNENQNDDDDYEDGFEIDHKTRDFKGEMKHSKLVRLHEVDGEGESHHDYDKKHRDIAEEQWSRIKEEFRRKMRESTESRESDESEYEEESEESNEDKNFEIFENRKNSFGPRSYNEEDDYRDNRKDLKDTRGSFGNRRQQQRQRAEQEQERQRKRNEVESRRQREEAARKRQFVEENSKRVQETERRNKEREERRREQEERQREDEERRREEEERREEENERRLERERENARREDENEKIIRHPMRPIPMNRRETNKSQRNVNDLQGSRSGEYGQSNMRDCIESTFNSWPSLAENHHSDDIMDLMCRNMDSIHSCLDKHPATVKSNGQARLNRLGHLKMIYQTLCDPNNRSEESKTIERVRQCLTDHNSPPSSSSGPTLQTKYPNGISSRLWR